MMILEAASGYDEFLFFDASKKYSCKTVGIENKFLIQVELR